MNESFSQRIFFTHGCLDGRILECGEGFSPTRACDCSFQNNEHDRLRKMLDEARLETQAAAAKARDQSLALEIELAKARGRR